MKFAVCLLIAICCASSVDLAVAEPLQDANEKVFLGYVAGKGKSPNYQLYTHLCHAFVTAEKNGTLKPNQQVPSHELAREAHAAGVKVLLSLGGWGWDEEFAAMVLDSEAEQRYVEAVMALVEEYDYDGIDLDWEYPDTNIEIAGFERLARRFRARLDELAATKQRDMLLTMAAAASPRTLAWLSNEFLLETMDWVNVMTYDYSGTWAEVAGHHSPMFTPKGKEVLSTERTMNYLLEERTFPADRIALGIPLYGKTFAVASPYESNQGAPKPRQAHYNYKQIASLANKPGWKRHWDNDTKNPWIIAAERPEIVCYDDAESAAIKGAWAEKHELRGVFFWQVDGDRLKDGSNPVQEAARNAFYAEQ